MAGKALFTIVFTLIFAGATFAQESTETKIQIPINRQGFHDKILSEKKLLLGSDGKMDDEFTMESNPDIAQLANEAINHQVDAIRFKIEGDKDLNQRLKIAYLVGLENILTQLRVGWLKKEVRPSHFAQIFSVYKKLVEVNVAGESIMPYVQHFPYDIAHTATLPRIFEENPEYGSLKDLLLLKYVQENPSKGFFALSKNPTSKHADSLIKVLAKQYPQQLYSYAQGGSNLSYKIRGIKDDSFVKTVVELAAMPSGQIYFPFLDNLVNGKVTLAQLDGAKNNRVQYYRLLVQTQMDYSRRALKGDTAIGFEELTARLQKKASDEFVNEINALHESPNPVRFKCLKDLTAQELYYLAVLTDGLIYTSSYVSGVFPEMMAKINNRGDSLLLSLSFDHYRKFISQAAGYNMLKKFFSTFEQQDATNLMTAFVRGLENSKGLADGVDVADSYASLYETLPDLAKQMLRNTKAEYDRNVQTGNKRGVAIYNILYKLFLSANPANKINLTQDLGIPPIYNIPFDNFTNEKGEVVTQMFFYADEDGMMDFDIFVRKFSSDPKWKVDLSNNKFVTAKSTSGVPVYVFANRPLHNTEDEDFVAQNAMIEYMEKNNLAPTVTFHRGHSYHAPTSVSYVTPTNRVVFMGSCGGFFLIDSILKKSSDAHIISSKQTGYRDINLPFIQIFLENLRAKNDVDWIPFWKKFRDAANITGMEDYIPPYKNLGALFIKAYKKETGEENI